MSKDYASMRNKKKLAIFITSASIIILVSIWGLFGIVPWSSFRSQNPSAEIHANSAQTLVAQENLRQSSYDCGAYNIHWLLQALGKESEIEDLKELNREKMIPRLGIVPEVIVRGLKKNNIKSRLSTYRWLSNEEKIVTLKAHLSSKNPLILLIKRHGYLHYVLLTGFEKNRVHFYDPMLTRDEDKTIDNNGEFAGNDALTFNELLNLWDKVSVFGFYENMAITIQP